jgi:hypothetical protein
VATN